MAAKPQGPLTPTQALQILNNATANLQLGRADHLLVIQSIQVLQEAITPKPSPEKVKQEVPTPKEKK